VSTDEIGAGGAQPNLGRLVAKVPEITLYFWITKVLTTGMGEAASDYLGNSLGTAIAMPLGGAALIAALMLQFRVRRYIAWVYWLAVVMVSVFGTMLADGIHSAGVPYIVSTIVFSLGLAGIFYWWNASEGTLDVHSIYTRRRERFYWATVIATFALGTAAGDMTASTFDLGYVSSVIVFAILIAVPAIGYWRFGLNPVVAFWFAYVVTRPLGASAADWMAVPRNQGGLGWGTGWVTLGMTAAIICFVGYLAIGRRGTESTGAQPSALDRGAVDAELPGNGSY
jgi:uncharacterized membrane-anchored protein